MTTSSISSSTSTATTPTTSTTSSTSATPSTSTATGTSIPNISTILGTGSGVDTTALAQALVNAIQQPQQALINQKINKANATISGYSAIRAGLTQLQTAFNALNNPSDFNSVTGTNNSSAYTVNTDSNAVQGNHTISVTALAAPQISKSSVTGAIVTDPNASIGLNPAGSTASLTLTVGTGSAQTIQLSSDDSLNGIAATINNSNVGVTANVVYTDSTHGYTLEITGNSGASNAFTLTSSNQKLSFSVIPGQSAADAEITVDGLSLSRSSNEITDAIPGVTLGLLALTTTTTGSGASAVTTDNPGKLGLQRDVTQVTTNIQNLVTAYNNLQSILKDASDPSSTTPLYGASLVGNSVIDTIKDQVLGMFTNTSSSPSGTMQAMRNVGVTVDSTGKMQLDSTVLSSALSSSYDNVVTMFTNNLPTDSYVTSSTQAGLAGDAVQKLTSLLDTTNGDNSGVLYVNSMDEQKQITSYQTDLQTLNDRMAKLLARYQTQFAAMDAMVGQEKSLGTSLTATFKGMSNQNGN